MSKAKRVWGGPEIRKQLKEDRLKKRKEKRLKQRALTESPTPSKIEENPKKKKKRTHSDASTDDGEPWMTGGLGMSASMDSSLALAEQGEDNVVEATEKKKKKKKKKAKHSHAVDLETEEKSEVEPPVTATKLARPYTPILPPPSPFARKKMAEVETSKAETILPLRFTPSASNGASKVAPAATSSIANDAKVLRNLYTQDWENTIGYVRANVKRNMDAESQAEEKIAFSEKYLSDPVRSETGVGVAGVNFRTLNVKAECLYTLTAPLDQPALQICSVAKGQVTVFLDEQTFDISKGGIWTIKLSEKCTVKRRKHKSTVYITTVPAV